MKYHKYLSFNEYLEHWEFRIIMKKFKHVKWFGSYEEAKKYCEDFFAGTIFAKN